MQFGKWPEVFVKWCRRACDYFLKTDGRAGRQASSQAGRQAAGRQAGRQAVMQAGRRAGARAARQVGGRQAHVVRVLLFSGPSPLETYQEVKIRPPVYTPESILACLLFVSSSDAERCFW